MSMNLNWLQTAGIAPAPLRYERNVLLSHPAAILKRTILKIGSDVLLNTLSIRQNRVYHELSPQPRSFLRDFQLRIHSSTYFY